MKNILKLCHEIVFEGTLPATEAHFGILIERLGRELRTKGWTSLDKVLPGLDQTEDYGSWINSKTVLVTDGTQIAHAYYQLLRDEGRIQWKLIGRDSYDLTFTPTHWMLMPEMP